MISKDKFDLKKKNKKKSAVPLQAFSIFIQDTINLFLLLLVLCFLLLPNESSV